MSNYPMPPTSQGASPAGRLLPPAPILYLITDSGGLSEEAFLGQIEGALQGGVNLVQLREKQREARSLYALACQVHRLTQAYQVPLLIDDRLDLALAVGAEGVHLGQQDLPLEVARRLLGPGFIIGATAKTVAQAQEAQRQGADYLGVGAIYPTATKADTQLTPVAVLQAICQAVSLPCLAIGGLSSHNLGVLQGSGIKGICLASHLMQAPDPRKEAATLLGLAAALL